MVSVSRLLANSEFLQTVELWPPGFSTDGPPQNLERQFSWLAERVEILGRYFDAFQIADLKRPRRSYVDSVTTASRLREKFKWAEAIPTISARDRNRKALREGVASALFSGMENLILVWGDKFLPSEEGESSNVYDVEGLAGLIRLAREVQSKTEAGELSILTPIDMARLGDDSYLEIVKGREAASSNVFLAQIFLGDPEEYLRLLKRLRREGVKSPVLHNVFPLLGYEDAVDISKRFGLSVSDSLLKELKEGGAPAGMKFATKFREALYAERKETQGVYVSSRGEPELAIRLVR